MKNQALYLVFTLNTIQIVFGQTNWRSGAGGVAWAFACDFNNHDLTSAKVSVWQPVYYH